MSKLLSLILQPIGIGFIVLGFSVDRWGCGKLLDSCLHYYKTVTIMLLLCLIVGMSFLIVAFSLDLVTIFSSSLNLNPTYTTIKLILSLIGVIGIFLGIFLYAIKIDRDYSQLICVIGIVIACQVALLNLFLYPCFYEKRAKVVVATTK
ncbi:hypothetical protein Smp_070370 [Schistosoma mansoni]|uniref:G_PROTEIN_RECEP_F3_4 domain-containing protein n=1 Tax=Schistosoma mansoni TaxID=6183 RepID=G4VT96_SCHMA|nr:hypothetical protein Smp_070370 [Schistosoma mansoni]|eukprot:XP_018655609.1 hypothetical protein Smp_070370 [Schistosoma mansoni]